MHVWAVDFCPGDRTVGDLERLLSDGERKRISAFKLREDERRFIVQRAALRILFERYGCGRSTEIRFEYSSRGKPSVPFVPAESPIHFSSTHCEDLALLTFSGAEVGVDLERVRDFPCLSEVAATFMSTDELRAFLSEVRLPRLQFFYLCWTTKESTLKMTGEGLISDPRELRIQVAPGKFRLVLS